MEAKTGEALDAMTEESTCEKIRVLISRNDFTTAEKLLERHSASFAKSAEDELRALIVEIGGMRGKENAVSAWDAAGTAIGARFYPWSGHLQDASLQA